MILMKRTVVVEPHLKRLCAKYMSVSVQKLGRGVGGDSREFASTNDEDGWIVPGCVI